jgi:hypothetical protein
MSFSDIVQNAAGISAIIATLTLFIGVVAFAKSVLEYVKQNSLKRFENFQEMRKRFRDENFQEICYLLEEDDPKLLDLHYKQRRDFLGFYEEIALMHDSRLLKTPIAHYMFGYYAIRCYESVNFWHGLEKDSLYWSLFVRFAKQMKEIEDRFEKTKEAMLPNRFKF